MILSILFSLLFLVGISTPIIVWAYVFTIIGGEYFYKKLFIVGILSGMLAVIPILYMDSFMSFLEIPFLSIFSILFSLDSFSSYIQLFFAGAIFLCLLSGIWLVYGFRDRKYIWKVLYSFFLLLIMVLFGVFAIQLFFDFFPGGDSFIPQGIYIHESMIRSLQMIILYYFMIAFLEESGKYFSFSGMIGGKKENRENATIGIIFVALGFSFLENILYVYAFYQQSGFSPELLKLGIFRGIFSTILHVFCSMVMYQGFSRIKNISWNNRVPVIVCFLFLMVAVLLHSIYNILLTVGVTIVVFVYLVAGYLYIGACVYHQKTLRNSGGEEIG